MTNRLTLPLILGILLTIVFNFSPIVFGHGTALFGAFLPFLGVLVLLNTMDRRVLGYATVISACNPAAANALLSFSLMLALVTIWINRLEIGNVMQELRRGGWWYLFVAALACVVLSVPFWGPDIRDVGTEVKNVLSRLCFVVAFPLAVGVSLRGPGEARRAITLLCMLAIATLAIFHFAGTQGVPAEEAMKFRLRSRDVFMQLGRAYMNTNRTQSCILLAGLAACSVGLAVGTARYVHYFILRLAVAGLAVFLLMQYASTGSAFAMVVGLGMVALGYLVMRPSALRVIGTVLMFAIVGSSLVYAVFSTENKLAERIDLKMRYGSIDRWEHWRQSLGTIVNRPLGSGWTTEFAPGYHAHNDFFCYFLSYGWVTGLLYTAACIALGLYLLRRLLASRSLPYESHALVGCALAGIVVYGVNSMLDMLSANICYYQTLWAIVLLATTTLLQEQKQEAAWPQFEGMPAEPLVS